ncbi:MAG: CsoR family transcriptional regulator, copper-sensing transcriptional repressor, partial [Mycobacterium sp.]|nr:CsoR family transcriptional regulator, copper-sensing transcriptional repressor [Mycobacterium sp.]
MAGYIDDKDEMLARLVRIEGQVLGLARMIERDTYCSEVLTQVSVTTRALQSVALELLDDQLTHCVREAAAQGGDHAQMKIREASAAL